MGMTLWERLGLWVAGWGGRREMAVSAVPVGLPADGLESWAAGAGANDRPRAEMQTAYSDALEAWRKHPHARRIIDITTDHVLGDKFEPQATGVMGRFVRQFWEHRQNRMVMRLPAIVDELNRAGDVFIVLFRNPADGMSYVRPIPKSQILKIETADNDWETEVAYHERQGPGEEPRAWLSPQHPDAAAADAVMVHYAINRPVGALWGDGDLTAVIPWLLRYSAMLEDRVRLNWLARFTLWFVKVPKSAVQSVREKYRKSPPPPNSIVVHSEDEEWDVKAPNLAAADAANDLKAIRMMIAVGSGQPPHWHGDSMDVNLATATAMERAAIRHLRRRQQEVADMVIDLCYTAYTRAYGMGATRKAPSRELIAIDLPDLSRDDNALLATAGSELAAAFNGLNTAMSTGSRTLQERTLRTFFQFIAEPLAENETAAILDELEDHREQWTGLLPIADSGADDDTADDTDDDAPSFTARYGVFSNGHGR